MCLSSLNEIAKQKASLSYIFPQTHESISSRPEVLSAQIRQIAIGTKILQPTPIVLAPTIPQPSSETNGSPWGVSKQIDEHTWTIKVGQDQNMATPQEILVALNAYRQRFGKGTLSWDDKLAEFANNRADFFTSISKLDNHAGFLDYVNNQDGFKKLGFASLGENSSVGYRLEGVHLIEWVYAGDKPHNDNQLNSQWQYVGIGVNGTATDLVFGGNKF